MHQTYAFYCTTFHSLWPTTQPITPVCLSDTTHHQIHQKIKILPLATAYQPNEPKPLNEFLPLLCIELGAGIG